MSTFDDEFDAFAGDELMTEFGEAATYSPHTGDDVSLTAVMSEEQASEVQEGDRLVKKRTRTAYISTAPASQWGGVAAVDLRGTFTYSTIEYSIDGLAGAAGSFQTLNLSRPELGELGRDQYRGRRY